MKMVYQVLLTLNNATLLKEVALEAHRRRLPCQIRTFRTVAALIDGGTFDYADAVLVDASMLNAGALMASLMCGALGRRLMVFGGMTDERTALVLSESGVQCQPMATDAHTLCDVLEEMFCDSRRDAQRDAVHALLGSLPISATLKGGVYIETALRLAMHTPALMDSLKSGLYARVAEMCGVSAANVERDIRCAIIQCWERMQERQKRALLAGCAHRPAPKLFLMKLLRRLRREGYTSAFGGVWPK